MVNSHRTPERTDAAGTDADWLAALARELGAETDVDAVWGRVVAASLSQVEGADHAGITLLSQKSVSTPVASDDLVRVIDQRQYAIGQGPCLTAARDQQAVVHAPDLATDTRWPEFGAAVADLDVRSMLSFQLYTETGPATTTIGALNIYSATSHAFTDDSVHTGTLLAAHAAVAVAAATKSSNLRIALDTRDTIGQAKGVLMERYKITAAQAFDLLIAASQRSNSRLKDVAAHLADTGELVDRPRP